VAAIAAHPAILASAIALFLADKEKLIKVTGALVRIAIKGAASTILAPSTLTSKVVTKAQVLIPSANPAVSAMS